MEKEKLMLGANDAPGVAMNGMPASAQFPISNRSYGGVSASRGALGERSMIVECAGAEGIP